ncbi:hypothetical protein BJ322DRAFT_1106190 [Thelephora terrestris]|uniref:Uncharacterized protein n=1 Tax=Thelephora terrestris TaxID=56493 RepID=A0A9P6HIT6_9AGAM|nr:hypothetical protein BJ322DRAFT_1106190 [Thelephora terrestris]
MFGGDQRRSRNAQWSTAGSQQDGGQQPPTQPSSSSSGIIPGAPAFYDPSAVGPQPQPSLGDHQWLHSTDQQYASGLDTGAYSIPYRQQQSQSSAAIQEPFPRPQQQTAAQPQQLPQEQAVPHHLNQYNFVAPQHQPPQQTHFSFDLSASLGYRSPAINESYLYGQVSSNPSHLGQNASRLENYPYSQQFQFFNSTLSEAANNATPSSSSSELLASALPRGPSVSPAISDQSSQRNTSEPTPQPLPTPSTSATKLPVAAVESSAQKKTVKGGKKRKGVKRPRIGDDSTTDSDDDDVLGGVTDFSIHLTQPPRGPNFRFPTRL